VQRAILLLLAIFSGCRESEYYCDAPDEIVDSVGTVFAWDFERCAATRHPDTPPPLWDCGDQGSGIISVWNRFFEVAIACDSAWVAPEIRPIACTDDDDCMAFHTEGRGELVFECRVGLCQNDDTEKHPEDSIIWLDAETLCNAPLPRGVPYSGPDFCPGQDIDSGVPCPLPLPDDCMQPM
jgi:hypothetical protein